MGLDITAYSKLRHIGKHYDGDWCPDDDHINAYAYSVIPRSFRGLPILETTSSPSDDGLLFFEAGCYEPTDGTETHRFRAGSYGGYNRWREDLQRQFNPERLEDGPFYELIWFADNEGSIARKQPSTSWPTSANTETGTFRRSIGLLRCTRTGSGRSNSPPMTASFDSTKGGSNGT